MSRVGILESGWAAARERLSPGAWPGLGERVRGPLLTLATAIGLDLLARHQLPVAYPFPALMLTVVYAAYSGGRQPALVSALVTVLYAVHFLARPGTMFHYTPANAYTLVVVAVVAPATAVLVARLRAAERRARDVELTRDEVLALERRVSLVTEASRVLASSLDHEATLRALARLAVPAVADWCLVHVINGGNCQLVAAVHRDPARDLLVRALGEYDRRRPPLPAGTAEPELHEVSDELLRASAADPEQLKLLRALLPKWAITAPMVARGRTAGVITLVVGESGRSYGESDLAFAGELAGRAALAIDNALLHRDAEEAEQRYRMLFDGNPQPMWVFDVDTLAVLAVNDAAIRHYGYSRDEFLGMTIMDLRAPEDAPGALSGVERAGSSRGGTALAQHQRKDGGIVHMELISHELELGGRRARLVLATDVSDRTRTRAALHRSEEQLRLAQRRDAVGRVAGGVAHDFNNLLTTIRGFSEILLDDLAADDPRRKDVERIRNAADRGALLTRQLLAFGSRQVSQPHPLDLNALVSRMDGLVRRLLGADITVVTRLAPELGKVKMDPGHLEQIVVNLVLNAREAMPSGGTLTIETGERQVSRSTRGRHVRPGRYVMLVVSDTGVGMDGDALSTLFEPFAAGREAGRGGLGLPIIHGIVRQAGGVIRVQSEPGEGTTVKIYLPRLDGEDAEVSAPALSPARRGSETILVAEDEDGVRELLRAVLAEHGYTVLAARHGRDALLAADQHPGPIHLLLTDVVMPEMGGTELAGELRPRRPELKVLYLSGYTSDEILRRGVADASAPFIHKPFTPDELMRAVREVLDAAPAGAGAVGVTAPGAGGS